MVVAVAGTHGKTTTTSMIALILAEAGRDPTALVGGRVAEWESGLRLGRDDLFVVEADEYDRSFFTLAPQVVVLTSVEADHLIYTATWRAWRRPSASSWIWYHRTAASSRMRMIPGFVA